MNAITGIHSVWSLFSEEPLLGRLFFACVEMPVLAALVWAVIRLGLARSPRMRSLLWLLVLAKPLVVISMGVLFPVVQIEAPGPAVPVTHEVSISMAAQHSEKPGDTLPSKGGAALTPVPVLVSSEPAHSFHWPWSAARTLVWGWAAGVILFGLYLVLDRLRLHALVARSVPVPNTMSNHYRDLACALHVKRPPALRITESLESPAIVGVLHPAILLPAWLAKGEWNQNLEWSLRHELTHWKLGDPWANALRQAAQALFFFHPVTWWVSKEWRDAAELACDRAVVHTPDEVEVYAGNLYQVLAQVHGRRQRLATSALFATRTQIGRRIAELLSDPLKHPARLGTQSMLLFLGVAAIGLGVGGTFGGGDIVSATASDPADVQKNVEQAINSLSTTSEFERDKIKTVFDLIKAQPNKEALSELSKWLTNDVATKRRSAVYILGALPWLDASPAFPPLRDLLKHDEQMTRGMAALTLAALGDSASHEAFARMMREDSDPYARRCAAWALGELGDSKALEPLQAALSDKDPMVVSNAQNAIERLTFLGGYKDATGNAQQVVRGLWLISGSTPWDTERLDRALALIQNAAPSVRDEILKEAAASSMTAIKNSAQLAMEKLGNALPAATKAPAPTSSKRNWGPEQATGAPNTEQVGDLATAWASLSQDDQPEWLQLKYAEAVVPKGVKIYETFNPGAVNRVSIVDSGGKEVEVWQGQDPTVTGSGKGVSEISFLTKVKTDTVKIYLDSPRVPGWNEIDAVGLVDEAGNVQWATQAEASSTFAEPKAERQSEAPVTVQEDPGAAAVRPANCTVLSHVDNTAEGKWSLGASGHATLFERPANAQFVEAIEIGASRYGTPEPPEEDFHIYLLNEAFEVLADLPYPYRTVERADLRWYTLRTPSIEVPERFYVAIAFNPNENKGIYLGLDRNVTQSRSFKGLPSEGFDPVAERYDWLVHVCLSQEPSKEKGVQLLADWQPPKHVDPFEGCLEAKYDTGQSEGRESYSGAGPSITFNLDDFPAETIPAPRVIKGFRIYGSRYGSGFDPETTMLKLSVQDAGKAVLYEHQFPYALFGYKEKWVDVVLPMPLELDKVKAAGGSMSVAIDPEAHQFKGIYFHYNKVPVSSRSSFGSLKSGFEAAPDREWMIRACIGTVGI